MPYSATNAGKLMDHLESTATEWMMDQVCSFFEVDGIEDLSKDQVREIFEYNESDSFDQYVSLGLRNVIERWSQEHEDEEFL